MAWQEIAAAAAGKALEVFGTSTLGNYFSKKENKKARDYNYNMWLAENAYNSPTAQMSRLKAAGLNPNLVYGNGATTLSARSTPAQPAAVSGPNFDTLGAIRAYQDIQQVDAQTQNYTAQLSLIKAQKKEVDARREETRARTQSIVRNSEIEALGKSYDNMQKYLTNQILMSSLPSAMEENKHKTGFSYRYSRNVGEWVKSLSPFIEKGLGALFIRKGGK